MPEPKKLVIHNPELIAQQAAAAAAAAAAEAKKAAPYERLWGRNTPPPTIENMDASTAWWKPPELKGLISNNMRGY